MKPWEDVKRRRLRKRLITYGVLTIVIIGGLIALLSGPARQSATKSSASTPQSRNQARKEALASMSAAINVYLTDHSSLPTKLPTTPTQICSSASAECKKTKAFDLNYLVTTDTGLASIPVDPVGGKGISITGFTIMQNDQGKLVFAAPRAEAGAVIELKSK